MSVDWDAFLNKKIAVVCRSSEECEDFLRQACAKHIGMQPYWNSDFAGTARKHWWRVGNDGKKWSDGIVYAFSTDNYIGYCWAEWWLDRGYQLVYFSDQKIFSIDTLDDLV